MAIKFIKNREWDLIAFDKSRIERAIEKAWESAKVMDFSFVDEVCEAVVVDLEEQFILKENKEILDIEKIQDTVENKLMELGHFEVAKKYVIYRENRNSERDKLKNQTKEKLTTNTLQITKTSWEKELFDIEKIRDTYKRVSYWLARVCKFEDLQTSLNKYIIDWIKTSDILKMMIKSSIDLITVENTSWQFIAWRLLTIDLYKEASRNRNIEIKNIYKPSTYKALFDEYINDWKYYKDFYKYYSEEDILEAGKMLKKDTDFTYNYTTVLMYKKRYLLNPNKIIKELPQEMYMSAALFLAIPEAKETRIQTAFKIY